MYTEAVEDYLKSIFKLESEQGKVTTCLLAHHLGVAPASVSGMLKKLAAFGLVTHRKYQGAVLTPEGRRRALQVIRHHRLAELYLREVLGLPLEEVHAEAHKWEHVLSEKVAHAMEVQLDHPACDPHGAPIPTQDGRIAETERIPLENLETGQTGFVTEISDHDPELLRYLSHLGLLPGAHVHITSRKPFNGPVSIYVAGCELTLGSEVTRHVFVRVSVEE